MQEPALTRMANALFTASDKTKSFTAIRNAVPDAAAAMQHLQMNGAGHKQFAYVARFLNTLGIEFNQGCIILRTQFDQKDDYNKYMLSRQESEEWDRGELYQNFYR